MLELNKLCYYFLLWTIIHFKDFGFPIFCCLYITWSDKATRELDSYEAHTHSFSFSNFLEHDDRNSLDCSSTKIDFSTQPLSKSHK